MQQIQKVNHVSTATLVRQNFIAGSNDWTWYVVIVFLVLSFSASSAFETRAMGGFWLRLGFFSTMAIILLTICHVLSAITTAVLRRMVFGNMLLQIGTAVATGFIGSYAFRSLETFLSGQSETNMPFAEVQISMLVIVPLITIVFHYMHSVRVKLLAKEESRAEPFATGKNTNDQSLQAGDPKDECRTAPIYMEADDHFVKIVYEDRIEMKRAKLTDEMQNWYGCGLQVHRSFWINSRFAAERVRSGRQLYLVLSNGARIPIGRSFERTIKGIAES